MIVSHYPYVCNINRINLKLDCFCSLLQITNMVDSLVNGSDAESSNLESWIVSTDKNVAVSAASSIKRERLSPYNDRSGSSALLYLQSLFV